MSDDVNKDIQKALKEAKGKGDKKNGKDISIPPPRTLQHGLDNDGVILSNPKTLIAEKIEKNEP